MPSPAAPLIHFVLLGRCDIGGFDHTVIATTHDADELRDWDIGEPLPRDTRKWISPLPAAAFAKKHFGGTGFTFHVVSTYQFVRSRKGRS